MVYTFLGSGGRRGRQGRRELSIAIVMLLAAENHEVEIVRARRLAPKVHVAWRLEVLFIKTSKREREKNDGYTKVIHALGRQL